ncbi:hypothetical protein [Streptomyces hundungensis]|nr:hypothetical protein [Streptomyces hundungensis]
MASAPRTSGTLSTDAASGSTARGQSSRRGDGMAVKKVNSVE